MNLPALPNKSYKLITYVGLAMVVCGAFKIFHEQTSWNEEKVNYGAEKIILNNNLEMLKTHLEIKSKLIGAYAHLHNIENPIQLIDSFGSFRFTVEPVISQPDSFLLNNINFLLAKSLELKEQQGQLRKSDFILSEKKKNQQFIIWIMCTLCVCGTIFLILGLRDWIYND